MILILRRALLLVITGLSLLGSGCLRSDPHQIRIVAKSAWAFGNWRSREAGSLTLDQWREFDAMIQEIRLRIMGERKATGSVAIDQAMRERIDGRTVGEALRLGCEAKQLRFDRLRVELQQAVHANAWLVTRPGDRESAEYIADFRQRQLQRLDGIVAEFAATEKRLVELDGSPLPPGRAAAMPAVSPAPLSRTEARQHIAQMFQEKRGAAQFKFGPYPLKIDREGAGMPEAERATFLRQRAEAEGAGRVVIPVWLKPRWWLYEGAERSPQFPAFVTANLSAADRREIAGWWQDLQAEIWARRAAKDSQ